MKQYIFFLVLLLFSACQIKNKKHHSSEKQETKSKILNKFSDTTLVKIYNLQNERKTRTLIPYLTHKKSKYREASALAFASIQDRYALPALKACLKDSHYVVRKAAAFALGQLGDTKAISALIPQAQKEKNITTKALILEAIGKCADDNALSFLTSLDFQQDSLKWGQVSGIYCAGLKGLVNKKSAQKIISFMDLQKEASEVSKVAAPFVRVIASHYMARFASIINIKKYQAELLEYLDLDDADEVRANCAKALAYCNPSKIVEDALLYTLEVENNVYVKIEVIRALSKFNFSNCKAHIFELLISKHAQIKIEASNYLRVKAENSVFDTLMTIVSQEKSWLVKANLLTALYRLRDTPTIANLLKSNYNSSTNSYEKGVYLKAIAKRKNNFDWISNILKSKQTNHVLKTYAFEALQSIRAKNPNNQDIHKKFGEVCRHAILTEDVGLVYLAAEAIQTRDWNYKIYFKDQEFMKKVLNQLTLPLKIEAYLALEKAISFINNHPIVEEPYFNQSKADWKSIQSIPQKQKVRFITSKGNFELQLLVEDAPTSVDNFIKLVKKGFYKGKYFHRVINNFVTQGGCPRGDGFGGQKELLRSEFTFHRYEKGSVGLASAGKDTESCQFFISHNSLPHLNGKYTIFAIVTKGNKVIEKLGIGDKIEKVEVL